MNSSGQFEYPTAVLERFCNPRHAGSLQHFANAVSAQQGSVDSGASIRLWLLITDGKVAQARFQAYGCPHFIASADTLAEWCEGQAVEGLSNWSWQAVQTELVVPPAKRGRLLMLESALYGAINQLRSTHSGGA